MTDLVERLRAVLLPRWKKVGVVEMADDPLAQEAADEIERLRKALRDVIRDVDGYNALLAEKERDGLTWVSVSGQGRRLVTTSNTTP